MLVGYAETTAMEQRMREAQHRNVVIQLLICSCLLGLSQATIGFIIFMSRPMTPVMVMNTATSLFTCFHSGSQQAPIFFLDSFVVVSVACTCALALFLMTSNLQTMHAIMLYCFFFVCNMQFAKSSKIFCMQS